MKFKLSTLSLAILMASSVQAEDESREKAETIVVTGSRIEQRLSDIPGSVSVVTDTDIEHRLVNNLDSMFRYDPSITTEGSGSASQQLTVRGVGGNRLVYIKDGRRSNDGYAGGSSLIVGRGYFDTESIKQVEVAKGAASSLYGSDSLGGIVVITTKDPKDYLKGDTSFAAAGLGYDGESKQKKASVTGAMSFGDWAASAVLTKRKGEEVQNYSKTLPSFDSDSMAALVKLAGQLDEHNSLKFTLDYFDQSKDQIVTPKMNETDDQNDSVAFGIDFISTAKTALYDDFSAQMYVSKYKQTSDQIRFSRGNLDNNDYRFEQNIFGLRTVMSKALQLGTMKHQIVYGFDFDKYDTERLRFKTRRDAARKVKFTNQPQKTFPGADTALAGLFVQDNISIDNTGLSFVAGLRFDYFDMQAKQNALYEGSDFKDIDETALSPKLAAIYSLNDSTSIYAQYMQGFKIPPHDQAYQSHGVEPFYQIIPNSDLKSEESDSFEVGVKFNNEQVSVNLTGFYNKFDNFIESKTVRVEPTFIPRVMKRVIQYQNISKTEIKGIELSSKYWLTDELDIQVNAAYTKGENSETNTPLTSISPLNGNVILNADFDDWGAFAAFRWAKGMTDVPEKTLESSGYGVVDLYAYYNFAGVKLGVGIDNALDKEYIPYQSVAGVSANSRAGKPTDLTQYTQVGRNVSVKMSYKF
ncbi:MAG: TonB-dependent hemoglobin/transferrin/lactoferrin family receptor [Parashewanella sp.]